MKWILIYFLAFKSRGRTDWCHFWAYSKTHSAFFLNLKCLNKPNLFFIGFLHLFVRLSQRNLKLILFVVIPNRIIFSQVFPILVDIFNFLIFDILNSLKYLLIVFSLILVPSFAYFLTNFSFR